MSNLALPGAYTIARPLPLSAWSGGSSRGIFVSFGRLDHAPGLGVGVASASPGAWSKPAELVCSRRFDRQTDHAIEVAERLYRHAVRVARVTASRRSSPISGPRSIEHDARLADTIAGRSTLSAAAAATPGRPSARATASLTNSTGSPSTASVPRGGRRPPRQRRAGGAGGSPGRQVFGSSAMSALYVRPSTRIRDRGPLGDVIQRRAVTWSTT